jgi:hypothetical protein
MSTIYGILEYDRNVDIKPFIQKMMFKTLEDARNYLFAVMDTAVGSDNWRWTNLKKIQTYTGDNFYNKFYHIEEFELKA